jgi:hypothetical protein
MAFGRTRKPTETPPVQAPRSLVAAAARVRWDGGQGLRTWRFGDDSWQQEAWRLYDIVGELRFIANWIGSACSKVRVYVANVDENGRIQGEVKNKKIGGLADTLFGSPASFAEAKRLLGINLTIAGDAYVIGRGTDDPKNDEWMVVSCSELKRWGTGAQSYIAWMYGDERQQKMVLDPENDLIIRIWTPHPRRGLWADSPTKGALPMLYEIERLTRYVFSQIDSRLFSGGLLPIPKNTSFPDEDGQQVQGAEALTDQLVRVGSLSLKGEGTAAGIVPVVVEVPDEALGKIDLINFASDLSKQAQDLRTEAIRRMALAMDIDPSILTGMGDANHWGAWQIFSGQIKIHIEPLMARICDGLTTAYLQPALESMGEDPDRYVYWFDTAPLEVRPERLKDTLELYNQGLVSKAAVLLSGDYAISDAPDEEEDAQKFIRDVILRDPNLFSNPEVRTAAGIPTSLLPATANIQPPQPGGAGPPPPPAPPTGIGDTSGGPMPIDSQAQNALSGPGGASGVPAGSTSTPPNGIGAVTASSGVPEAMNVFLVANATVLLALEKAGKRMLTHSTFGQFPGVPGHELYTKMPQYANADSVMSLLEGSWDRMDYLASTVGAELPAGLQKALETYCTVLIMSKQPHTPQLMGEWLAKRGFLHGGA